ncbi:MAG TPA: NAD-dependent epimerase/dehydratase family protein [Gemmatimonadales bacterium]|nr:NAD-dependent epimerase/dehydratase family protein [Gemmatimonadales bacterium]
MIRGKQILLTGGAGFIGTALATRLVDDNRIVVFDNGHRNSIRDTPLLAHPNLRYIAGDVLDAGAVQSAIAGCTHVVHLAAIAGVDTVLTMPVHTMKVSLIGTYHVLEAALATRGIERVIDFSTSEVFGTYAYKVREGDLTSLGAVGEARWTYAVSKLATEHLTHNYHVEFGLPSVAIRPFNIYGPGQVGEGAIHRFILQALKGEDITIHNDGGQIRAWCFVEDMVEGIVRALALPEAVGHSFNIGNPRSIVTVYHLAREIVRLSGSASRIVFVPWDKVDVELRIPNIEKARERLGFEPSVDLEEGLLRTIEWYRARRLA